MDKKLQILQTLPQGFFDIKAPQIEGVIDRPTLIHLKGQKKEPLFISILLHGDELSGLLILQKVLKKYPELPRDLIIFIGNPRACAEGVRHLEDQLDFNRIWHEDACDPSSYEYSMAKQVLSYVKKHKIVKAVDIHNNSGQNPCYACINKKDPGFVELGGLFSKNIIHFIKPDSVLSRALSKTCPAIVAECGLSGSKEGLIAGFQFIETLLNKKIATLKNLTDLSIYRTCATLKLEPNSRISFATKPDLKDLDFCFTDQFDEFNFKQVMPGLVLGKIRDSKYIQLINEKGFDVFDQFFSIKEENMIVKEAFTPSMFTKNQKIAKSDCLGYIMKKVRPQEFLLEN